MFQKKKIVMILIFLLVLLIAILTLINFRFVITAVTQKIVTGNALRSEMKKMNKSHCGMDWYVLDYVNENLIITHNRLYMVVLKKQEGEWSVTALVNPSRLYHFRLQGSTISSIELDESGRYVAILYYGIDDTNEPLYIFDLELNKLKEYPHNEFPADIVFVESENRIPRTSTNISPRPAIGQDAYDVHKKIITLYDKRNNIVKEIQLNPAPYTSIYWVDEATIAYMYSPYNSGNLMVAENILGAWRICFLNIDSEEIKEVVIQ